MSLCLVWIKQAWSICLGIQTYVLTSVDYWALVHAVCASLSLKVANLQSVCLLQTGGSWNCWEPIPLVDLPCKWAAAKRSPVWGRQRVDLLWKHYWRLMSTAWQNASTSTELHVHWFRVKLASLVHGSAWVAEAKAVQASYVHLPLPLGCRRRPKYCY